MKGPQDEWREKCWDEIATYAWAVAASKDLVLPRNSSNFIAGGIPDRDTLQNSAFLSAARARNLSVLVWSFCEEVDFPMAYDFSHVSGYSDAGLETASLYVLRPFTRHSHSLIPHARTPSLPTALAAESRCR